MANWNKKVSKAAKDDLAPGEEIVASVFLQPTGTMGKAVGHGVGGLIGRAVASKLGGGTDTIELVTDEGIAARFPAEPTVLGLTPGRLLVYGYSSLGGKPKGLKQVLSSGDLSAVELDKQKATYRCVLHFGDGTAAIFEAPRVANDPEAFAAAVNG
jgi:hypothetical protein